MSESTGSVNGSSPAHGRPRQLTFTRTQHGGVVVQIVVGNTPYQVQCPTDYLLEALQDAGILRAYEGRVFVEG